MVRWLQHKSIGQWQYKNIGKVVTVQEYWPVVRKVTAQEYWPVVRWLQYKNIGLAKWVQVVRYSTRILASGKVVTVQEYWPVVTSGYSTRILLAQEYWPVVRWLQYNNIGLW